MRNRTGSWRGEEDCGSNDNSRGKTLNQLGQPLEIRPEASRDGKEITLTIPEHRYLIGACLLDRFDKLTGPYPAGDAFTRISDCLGDILFAATRDLDMGVAILKRVQKHFLAEADGEDNAETITLSVAQYTELTK